MHCFNLSPSAAVTAVALLATLPTAQAGLYTKNSPVLQVDAKNYDRLIAKSNHTSVVEFYAPWCGHCQNLKPAYEKAAKNLEGLAKVAAVNCDEDENKQFCGVMGVKGFPTLKIVRPGKKSGKPVVEDYNGPRSAKGIVDAVVDKISNHVKRVTDKDLDSFLSTNNDTAKAILFTEKGTTSALLRSLAIDFLDVISFAQIRNKESKAVEAFGIQSYPTLVVLPGGDKDGLVYQGEMKKPAMLEFLSQVAQPNPDPAPAKSKGDKKAEKKTNKKAEKPKKEKKEKVSKEDSSETASTTTSEPTETSTTEAKPKVADATPIPVIASTQALINECLHPKAHTCVLAYAPATHDETAEKALSSLSEVSHKYAALQRKLFPIFEVRNDIGDFGAVFGSSATEGGAVLVAVNAKRRWFRYYQGDFSSLSVETWIDSIRMNEGPKEKLPEGLIGEVVQEEKPAETVEVKVEEDVKVEVPDEPESSPSKGVDPTPEATNAPPKHEECLVHPSMLSPGR
ncbi:thioredoxin-domain-containing protein [Xylariaceae sp. FL0594]|nr:thioredoxin-domain-containing protein [Xylariaceae sp. FL0594]